MDLADGYATLLKELRESGRLEEAAKTADKASARLAETTEETTDFLGKILGFRLAAHAVAVARAKADPDAEVNTEPEATAAVNALRQYVLAGGRNTKPLQADLTEPLRQRADIKELLVRMDELGLADAKAKLTTATAEEKLAARQSILITLEALAGPPPHTRSVRRSLAQARQDWAQALLGAGRVDEARLAFDDALLARQQLVQESPSYEQLRADLAQSQSAAGDLFAAAGNLADAVKTWDKALTTLEEGLKTNPNSVAFQTALVERLTHFAYQEGRTGLWDRALQHHRQAFLIQKPTSNGTRYFAGLFEIEAGNSAGYQALAAMAAGVTDFSKIDGVHAGRLLVLTDDGAARNAQAVRRLADDFRHSSRGQEEWLRGLAHLRL
ncbi:MAG: hypothetical protein L0Y72_21525, partial [Gemmataceae bacterium]|nr:hypothetical protein [Gemmataceae bacterium]